MYNEAAIGQKTAQPSIQTAPQQQSPSEQKQPTTTLSMSTEAEE